MPDYLINDEYLSTHSADVVNITNETETGDDICFNFNTCNSYNHVANVNNL